MRPALRALDRRLRRVAALVERWRPERERERASQAARRFFVTASRAGLAAAGLDPDRAVTLRRFERPDPAPPRHPAIRPARPLDILHQRLSALVPRPGEPPPDLATASPAELFAAYCLGDRPAPA